jgi:isoleucyl-tRNA synthetase
MRGYRVPRKAGWDTHGLPVEVEVEKSLRIHGKAAIEEYGVEPFIAQCIKSVFRYTDEWEKLTERVGFWVDLPSAYVTYHKSYVESVWWALSELFRKGLLYQGHKVVWWWAQGGTALSSGEVGEGYKTVDDPSAYVAFPLHEPLAGKKASLLIWTTTPWTLPSNMFAAVHPDLEYTLVSHEGSFWVVAKDLVADFAKKLKLETLPTEGSFKGSDLVGKTYEPPFAFCKDALGAGRAKTKSGEERALRWRVVAADFVTLDAGTGIVHIAPAFGEDDFGAFKKDSAEFVDPQAPELLCLVKPDGTFDSRAGAYAGRWVKEADKDLLQDLKARGILVHHEVYRHEYPFCVRADQDPLIQYARPAWYIRTTALIHKAIENNQHINWLPPHIRDGRFGDFLANNVDWALSRERYWGTPLNIWVNDVTGRMEAPSSVQEILAKNPKAFDHFHAAREKDPTLSEHLIVHKPWIDQVVWTNPGEEGTYRRVSEVIDCWFDSGCMPFAQWGFPHQGHEQFKESFPADFISEAIDQTRGWFYSLVMISTLLFDEETQKRFGLAPVRTYPLPFKTCIVLGHVSDREGKKESKSKGNYTPPEVILDRVRLEFAVQAPGSGGVADEAGTVWISREDLEGLDLQEGATVRVYRASQPSVACDATVKVGKKLKRRHVVLAAKEREALGVAAGAKAHDAKPVEVPWLADAERVTLEDPKAPAPGADAFRWFFYASNPPWNSTRHSLSNVRALQKDFLVKWRNIWSFFVIYANIDGFQPYEGAKLRAPAKEALTELDRFIRSELALMVRDVTADLDGYDVYTATQRLSAFVESVSNWYVRRSRERFWRTGWDADKESAFCTLYECLVTLAKVAAPFVPFMAETIYQNLVVGPAKLAGATVPDSVHLASFPEADLAAIDTALSAKMANVRDLVSLGLQVRTSHKLKVRQPLKAAHLLVAKAAHREELASAEAMIREELNVLAVNFVPQDRVREFVDYKLKPNFRTLGQRGLGRAAQELKKTMATLTAEQAALLQSELLDKGKASYGGVELLPDDVEVSFETKEGFAAAGGRVGVVVLETALDDALRELGFLRELQNRIQAERKEQGLEYTDRISVQILCSERVKAILDQRGGDLTREVLAASMSVQVGAGETSAGGAVANGESWQEFDVEGEKLLVCIQRT